MKIVILWCYFIMASYLVFRDTLFVEVEHSEVTSSDLAVLVIDGTESTLHFSESITLIDKLTAQRQTNSIVRTGFLLHDNSRVGTGSNLKIVVGSIPLKESSPEVVPEPVSQPAPSKQPTVPQAEAVPETTSEVVSQPAAASAKEPGSNLISEPIRFTVPKEDIDPLDNAEVLGFSGEGNSIDLPEQTDETAKSDSGPAIQDIFREEQKKVMADSEPAPATKTYDEVIEYFWKELFGQVYSSWETLPEKAKEDFFASLSIGKLSDEEVQALFTIRHENNIEGFKAKLNEIRERNKE